LLNIRCFLPFGTGQALVEAGESYKHLAEIKYNLEDNIKQNFIEPLTQMQNKDLKEVNVSTKLLYNIEFICLVNLKCQNIDTPTPTPNPPNKKVFLGGGRGEVADMICFLGT
jgi:hypothetical protein